MTRDSKESVLSRWSRRKLEVEQSAPETVEPVQLEMEASQSAEAAAAVDVAEQPVLTDADMPDIDSLTEDSDFSGFMSSGVSDELRNLALRKLFKAPVFNIRDGLDEYDEDYTYFEKLGDIVTCDMKHQIEMQEKKLREAQAAEEAAAEQDAIEEIEDDEIEAIESTGDELEPEPDEQVEIVAQAEPESKLKHEANDEQ
jgi:hypothetical protein